MISSRSEAGVGVVSIGSEALVFMTEDLLEQLASVTQALDADPSIRVIVFTGGASGVFIQHHDVSEIVDLARRLQQSDAAVRPRSLPMAADAVYAALDSTLKPTIAAINGNCMGGGLEFALCCDFRIAQSGDFLIGLVEAQFDCLPGGGGTQRLTRLIGYAKAIEFLLLGATLSPSAAARAGIVHAVADDALADAVTLARRLAERSPRALGHIKFLARLATEVPLPAGLAEERARLVDVWSRPDALSRLESFLAGGWNIEASAAA